MKCGAFGVVPLMAAACLGVLPNAAQASSTNPDDCTARVLHSEELPYAPIGYWLVQVTLEVTPSNGPQFVRRLLREIPRGKSPPRRGESYRLRCSSANEFAY